MKWFEFDNKQPRIGEEILVIKETPFGCRTWTATYSGIRKASFKTHEVRLINIKKYIEKTTIICPHSWLSTVNLVWTRLD